VVRMAGEQRTGLSDVQNLLIPTPRGDQVPLYQLANVEIKEGPNQIQREDAKRRIIIGFNVRGRDVQSIVNELQQKVENQINFPPGYYVTYGGAFENLNAAKQRLSIAVPVSLLLIFVMLYFAFNSIKHGLLIYSAIPLSAIGGIFALALRGMPFSISAGVGFIALFGVAVLNGIVLIAEFNRLKAGGDPDMKSIVLSGTKVRLRPVLMTALVASLGFLPMALSNGSGAEVQRPLATVVIGGLLIATFLTLFVLPILYIIFETKLVRKKKSISPIITMLVLAFTFITLQPASAQTPITLQAAIDTALVNNQMVKNERLMADYQKQLIKSGLNIPQTTVMGEYGQINSSFSDNRFVVNQNINFPTVYSNQKLVLKEEWKSSVLNVAVKEAELKKQVSQVYYTLANLLQKKKLLLKNDSLYGEFLVKANLRFKTGESNVLEKTTAETQRGQIALQLNQLNADLDLLQAQFQLLLNTPTALVPPEDDFKMGRLEFIDSASVSHHPTIEWLEQQKIISMKKTQLEKSKLLPDLSFSYNNMTMRGAGADNVLYDGSTRFQAGQIGIGIPLFYGAQKAKINASKSMQRLSDDNYRFGLRQFNTEYQTAVNQYINFSNSVDYFEKTGLKNASLIRDVAQQQFTNGGINYIEWVMLINQAVSINNDYLSAVNNLNESIIQLNYFLNK